MFYRNLLTQNVSVGGSFDAEQETSKDKIEKETSKSTKTLDNVKEGSKSDASKTLGHSSYKHRESHQNKDKQKDKKHSRDSDSSPEKQNSKKKESSSEVSSQHDAKIDSGDTRSDKIKGNDGKERKLDNNERTSYKSKSEGRNNREESSDDSDGSSETENHEIIDLELSNENKGNYPVKAVEVDKEQRKPSSTDEPKVCKFAKRSSEETVLSARERYLARKMAKESVKANAPPVNDSDED